MHQLLFKAYTVDHMRIKFEQIRGRPILAYAAAEPKQQAITFNDLIDAVLQLIFRNDRGAGGINGRAKIGKKQANSQESSQAPIENSPLAIVITQQFSKVETFLLAGIGC